MPDRIDALLQRSRLGDVGLTPDEKKELQRALYGAAPSSKRYKDIYNLLRGDGPAESSYVSPSRNPDGSMKRMSDGPTFQGPPTLDFLNLDHQGMVDIGPSAARGADAGGDFDPDTYALMKARNEALRKKQTQSPTDTPLEEAFNDNMAFSGGFHGPGRSAMDIGSDILDEVVQPGQVLDPGTQYGGYEFADMTPMQQIQLHQDPRVMAALYAEAAGGGDGTAAFLMPFIEGADAMSQSGILGGQGRDNSIFGGPTSDIGQLAQIEDVMDVMARPGVQFFDNQELYRRSMERLGNTDFSQYSGQNGQPMGVDDIIQVSNAALMASAPFMSKTTQAAVSARLEQAGVQYKLALATGEIPMDESYPAYLRRIGADTWMGQ